MKTTQPYELLVRWDSDGNIAGAHVQWREVFTEGGETIAEKVLEPQPVAIGQAEGFPLADIMDAALSAALSSLDAKGQRIAELEAALVAPAPSAGA